MKKLPKILLLLGLVLLSCEEKELHEEPDADPDFLESIAVCDPLKQLISVEDVRGVVIYDEWLEDYVIKRGIDGTYDTVYMGFICDLPLEFQKQSTRVVFSGTYYEIEESKEELIPVRMVGEEYYILEIDEIMLVQSEE